MSRIIFGEFWRFFGGGNVRLAAAGKNRAFVDDNCGRQNIAGDVRGRGEMKRVAAIYVAENPPCDARRTRRNVSVDATGFAYVEQAFDFDVAFNGAVDSHWFGFGARKFRGLNRKTRADYGVCRLQKFVLRARHKKNSSKKNFLKKLRKKNFTKKIRKKNWKKILQKKFTKKIRVKI